MHCLWLLCFLMDPVDLSEICVVSVFDENMLKLNVLLFSVDNVNNEYVMRICYNAEKWDIAFVRKNNISTILRYGLFSVVLFLPKV